MDSRPEEGDVEAKSFRRSWRDPFGHLGKGDPGRGESKGNGPEAGMSLVYWDSRDLASQLRAGGERSRR